MPNANLDRLDERLINISADLKDISANVNLLVANNHQQDIRLSLLEEKVAASNRKVSWVFDAAWKVGLSVVTGYLLWKLGLPPI